MVNDAWIEVDLAALQHNFKQIKNKLADNVRVMAVVKGNGFGHGYVEPSRAFIEAGANALAVTRLDEALIIREAGVTAPLLLFAPIQAGNAAFAINADIEMTVTNSALVDYISATAKKLDKTARVHVKVDTGMGRLGVSLKAAVSFIEAIQRLPKIEVVGIYTHFASAADSNIGAASRQLQAFQALIQELKSRGLHYGLAHAANSAAILRMPESHLDMVRPGTLLYGQYPSQFTPHNLDLKSTWQFKTRISDIRKIPAGVSVGYGAEYTTKRITRTAIIPVGYADGFTLTPEGPVYRQSLVKFLGRKIRQKPTVEIRGQKAPVLGRVAMQVCVVDVTDIADVSVGDEVIVPAKRIPTSALIPRVTLQRLPEDAHYQPYHKSSETVDLTQPE